MKVMTLVGTRPEIIKLSCVIPELDRATEHVLVHTGQNYDYELNQIFFDGLGLRKPATFTGTGRTNRVRTVPGGFIAHLQCRKSLSPHNLWLHSLRRFQCAQ